MTPGARLAATIDLLDESQNSAIPFDVGIKNYFKLRRYAGSKDRRAIIDLTYDVLHQQELIDWGLSQFPSEIDKFRARLLGYLSLIQGKSLSEIETDFSGQGYAPSPLSEDEKALVGFLSDISKDGLPRDLRSLAMTPVRHRERSAAIQSLNDGSLQPPLSARLNIPAWLWPQFVEAFGDDIAKELSALNHQASTDIRANTLKFSRDELKKQLEAIGVVTTPTPYAPDGLRLSKREPLEGTGLYKNGFFEIQDEGSQLLCYLCDVSPGMLVADLCAGAGGKALALAALMENQGTIHAFDISSARLERAKIRANRADASVVQFPVVKEVEWYDRVLVDAPCSGTGTWRRHPEQRFRLQPEDLADFCKTQKEILASAAQLVRPQGLLIYATCSLLPCENEAQVQNFLEQFPNFKIVQVTEMWEKALKLLCPIDSPFLKLTPANHGTDGFFGAVLQRI